MTHRENLNPSVDTANRLRQNKILATAAALSGLMFVGYQANQSSSLPEPASINTHSVHEGDTHCVMENAQTLPVTGELVTRYKVPFAPDLTVRNSFDDYASTTWQLDIPCPTALPSSAQHIEIVVK
jgi:hypothetical protein